MNAANINQTVLLEKPDSAQFTAEDAALKPGFAISAGLNRTKGAKMLTTVTPINPIAPPGSGSKTIPTITPTKMAK